MHNNTPTKTPLIRLAIVVLILLFAVVIAYAFISNPEKTEKKAQATSTTARVDVKTIKSGDHPIQLELMGRVSAAKEVQLRTHVSGEIISVSDQFIPGGIIKKHDDILEIDPSDYALDVQIKTAAYHQEKATFDLEMGQQSIARDELKILEQTTGQKLENSKLALRKPQLEQARANLDAARANLDLAELNLLRTRVTAPFNALIHTRNSNIGNIVTTQDTLATLVGTDEYWIEAEIGLGDLQWLTLPDENTNGSPAVISFDNNRGQRQGALLKTTGSIDQDSRLASILITVPDPLLLNLKDKIGTTPLILGDFVHVTLIGKILENSIKIKREYIRDNRSVWILKDNKLFITPVTIAYADLTHVYIIDGLNDDDTLITSNIITPINGMDLMKTVQNDASSNKNATAQ